LSLRINCTRDASALKRFHHDADSKDAAISAQISGDEVLAAKRKMTPHAVGCRSIP
jgi:hypothetical protein